MLLKTKHSGSTIRRVIALPGDRVLYSKGILYINEKAYPPTLPSSYSVHWADKKQAVWEEFVPHQSYFILRSSSSYFSFGPYKIPDRHYFVMGDHRQNARDSRTWPVRGSFSKGTVTLTLKNNKKLFIPKGTVFRVNKDRYFPLFFETTQAMTVTSQPMDVVLKSQTVGLNGNIPEKSLWSVDEPFLSLLHITNQKSFSGGSNQSLIPLSAIQGKAFKILWSCDKTFAWIPFLCQFNSFRENRWLTSVHNQTNQQVIQ